MFKQKLLKSAYPRRTIRMRKVVSNIKENSSRFFAKHNMKIMFYLFVYKPILQETSNLKTLLSQIRQLKTLHKKGLNNHFENKTFRPLVGLEDLKTSFLIGSALKCVQKTTVIAQANYGIPLKSLLFLFIFICVM